MRVEQEMKMKTKIIPSLTKRSSGIFPTGAVFARFCLLCGEKFERPRRPKITADLKSYQISRSGGPQPSPRL